jgi:hypothetical protein
MVLCGDAFHSNSMWQKMENGKYHSINHGIWKFQARIVARLSIGHVIKGTYKIFITIYIYTHTVVTRCHVSRIILEWCACYYIRVDCDPPKSQLDCGKSQRIPPCRRRRRRRHTLPRVQDVDDVDSVDVGA